MQQQEIQFFWPLIEQIPLDLDYSPSIKYQKEKQEQSIIGGSYTISAIGGFGTITSSVGSLSTFEIKKGPDSVGAWQVYEGFNVYRSEKPKYFVRFFTKLLLGWEWKDK
jgi:hypothetical protein